MQKRATIRSFDKDQGKIIRIKEDSIKKINLTRKKIELRFDPNIKKLNSIHKQKINDIREINRNLSDLILKKKRLKTELKKFNTQLLDLKKKKKLSIIEKLTELDAQKNFKIKNLEKEINYLEKQLRILDARKFANKWKKWATFRKESNS